jgi:multidrug resistance efflux pump
MAARKKTTEPAVEENVVTEVEETQPTGKKKGPKPNPFTRVERAKAKVEKARAAYDKVQHLASALEEAEAEEQAALAALQEAVAAAGVSTS